MVLPDHAVFALRYSEELKALADLRPVVAHSAQRVGIVEQPVNPIDVDAAIVATRCDAALISLLGNDLFAAAADGRVELSEVAAATAALYEVVRGIALAAPRTFVLLYGYPYKDQNARNRLALQALNAAITSVVASVSIISGCRTIELIDEGALLAPDDWPRDDIHPFESGYIKIADEIIRLMNQEVA